MGVGVPSDFVIVMEVVEVDANANADAGNSLNERGTQRTQRRQEGPLGLEQWTYTRRKAGSSRAGKS